MSRNRLEGLWPDLLAVLFFAGLFLAYPLTDHLPGNCDTYLGMALADSFVSAVREFFSGVPTGRSMWPDDIHRLGETTPLVGLLLALVRGLGLSWAWTVWGLMVLIFSVNVWAIRRCVAALTGDPVAGVVVAFGFGMANTVWAHVDDLIVVCWAIPALCTWLVVRAETGDRPRWLLLAGAIGALQAYIAIYVFVFQSAWLGAWGVGRLRRADRRGRRLLLAGLALYVGLALPLVIYHASSRHVVQPVLTQMPWKTVHAATALRPTDWLATLPDNLLREAAPIEDTRASPYWVNVRRRASFGWLWLGLALLVVVVRGAPRIALGVTAALGLLFAVGGDWPPSTVLVEVVPWLRYLRVVSRAHLLVLFVATLAVGYVLAEARRRWPGRATGVAVALALGLHGLENLPVPMPGWPALPLEAPEALVEALRDEPTDAVVLHLPSDDALSMGGSGNELFRYNRELLYMLWQPQYGRSTVNGLSGYITPNRAIVISMVSSLPEAGLSTLRSLGVTHIAFHPRLALDADELRYAGLELELVVRTPELTLWRL